MRTERVSLSRMSVAILPRRVVQEEYLIRLEEILEPVADTCRLPSQGSLLQSRLRGGQRFDALYLQWIDNKMIDDRGRLSMKGVIRAYVKVLVYRLWARRIVFVRHNRYPHRTHPDHAERVARAVDRFERWCDRVVVHSPVEAGPAYPHRVYCPHPLYEVEPATETDADLPERLVWEPGYFVSFGRMEPYKHLPDLIDAFPESQRLLVFGAPPTNKDYQARLELMQRPGVHVVPAFLDNAVIQHVLRKARGLIVVHADRDMIASGSVVYALSLGIPVFGVETPYLCALAEQLGPELIQVAGDIPSLMAVVAAAAPEPRSSIHMERIQQVFGDHVVREALCQALFESGKD